MVGNAERKRINFICLFEKLVLGCMGIFCPELDTFEKIFDGYGKTLTTAWIDYFTSFSVLFWGVPE